MGAGSVKVSTTSLWSRIVHARMEFLLGYVYLSIPSIGKSCRGEWKKALVGWRCSVLADLEEPDFVRAIRRHFVRTPEQRSTRFAEPG